jgi:mannose-6-phosphate isomerase-like protein (cupin superfamily)
MGNHRVDQLTWVEDDFQPVVEFGDWLVALMNWSPRFDLSGWGTLERHNHTDEVFVLQKGRAVLFVDTDAGLECIDMTPGVVCNVTQGTWHNVIGTTDVQWLIVESRHAPDQATEYRPLTDDERINLLGQFPEWLVQP